MWGYGMLSRRPAWGDERYGKEAREGQGYPCYQHDMMIMMIMIMMIGMLHWLTCDCELDSHYPVWETASFLGSSGIFSVFWPISTMGSILLIFTQILPRAPYFWPCAISKLSIVNNQNIAIYELLPLWVQSAKAAEYTDCISAEQ